MPRIWIFFNGHICCVIVNKNNYLASNPKNDIWSYASRNFQRNQKKSTNSIPVLHTRRRSVQMQSSNKLRIKLFLYTFVRTSTRAVQLEEGTRLNVNGRQINIAGYFLYSLIINWWVLCVSNVYTHDNGLLWKCIDHNYYFLE